MEVNYSNYTISELEECLRSIDKHAYPENYQLLQQEITARQSEIEVYHKQQYAQFVITTQKRLTLISWLQLFTALAFIIVGIAAFQQSVADASILFVIACFNALSGYFLLKRKRLGFYLSYLNQVLQLFSVSLGTVYFSYGGVGTLMLVIQDGIEFTGTIFNPYFYFFLGKDLGFAVAIDLVAFFFLGVLHSCLKDRYQWLQ
ncbi:hypothetical protein AAEU32_11735 [Pseudoalteromonas sp. SSDWG2]|uniref:hypothetical protein n=1 Tax=Pseudoalteromonas sp. SSDWG2 TaxID=3139391 RepID=UPI003BAB8ECF